MKPANVSQGEGPIILGQPHGGTFVPPEIWATLNDNGKLLADTDWHISQVYDGLLTSATVVVATFHRCVIDANRDPQGGSLYPGQNTTGLCPVTDFDGLPLYHSGQEPNPAQVEQRRVEFHAPYHAALAAEVARVKAKHGYAVVFDCHSIRSHIPFLFEGTLPDLNIGTDTGKTCALALEEIANDIAKTSSFTSVLNGRFRGGWTTRHYGQPSENVHAIQMEVSQSTYLAKQAAPWSFDKAKASALRAVLQNILTNLESFRP